MPAPADCLTAEERTELVRLRRDLHRHPELAFQEHRTAGIVADHLRQIGYDVHTGLAETGVVAVLRAGEGPYLGLRADMDALPIQEVAGRSHGSLHDGVMHACGHDGHVATLLTAATVLARTRDTWSGTLKLLFQPAEEGGGGAHRMMEDGVLDDPRPDALVGLHYWTLQPTGTLGVKAGATMASVDSFDLVVRGKGGHAAIPHEAADALVAASAVVTALQTVVSRRVDPLQPAVVTVGEFHAGTTFNVIAGEARLAGTVRTLDDAVWDAMPAAVAEVCQGVCAAHGCTCELDYRRLDRPLVNDPEVTRQVRGVAEGLVGPANVVEQVTMGGEDMGEYFAVVPGCFFFVGARNDSKGIVASHHHPEFDLDEDALSLGVEMLVRVVRSFLTTSSD